MALGERSGGDSTSGVVKVDWTWSSNGCWLTSTKPENWTGTCGAWMARRFVRLAVQVAAGKGGRGGAGGPRARAFTRRLGNQDPPRLRPEMAPGCVGPEELPPRAPRAPRLTQISTAPSGSVEFRELSHSATAPCIPSQLQGGLTPATALAFLASLAVQEISANTPGDGRWSTARRSLVTDGQGLPLAAVITPGQAHESKSFEDSLNAVRIPHCGPGRPRRRPTALSADKGYSYRRIRHWLHRHKIQSVIPQRSNQVGRIGGHRGFDKAKSRRRNVVERCVGWLKECRRVATRFEKLAVNDLGMIDLAIIQRLLRVAVS